MPASIAPASLSAPRQAPWDALDLFAPKPDTSEYGWRWHGRSHPCTREELIERCRSSEGKAFVELVWTPDAARLVPPAEVPWLLEPLRQRAQGDLRHNLRLDAGVLIIGILYLWNLAWKQRNAHGPTRVPGIYLAIFLVFAIVPAAQDFWALARLRKSFAYLAEQAASLRYGVWLGGRRIVATYFIGGALLAVWAAEVVIGAYRSMLNPDTRLSVEAAGLVKPIPNGQWWRLLTAEMLHGHWLHFVLNLLSLLAVGRLVEVHASPAYLPTVFLFSALTASLTSLWLSSAPSVGASGAIMGLIGFLAVLGYRRRHVLPPGFMKAISLSIALTAGAGLVAFQVVDNAAHLGGLAGGVLLGLIYVGRRGDDFRLIPSRPSRAAGYLSALILVAIMFITIWVLLQARLRDVPIHAI